MIEIIPESQTVEERRAFLGCFNPIFGNTSANAFDKRKL